MCCPVIPPASWANARDWTQDFPLLLQVLREVAEIKQRGSSSQDLAPINAVVCFGHRGQTRPAGRLLGVAPVSAAEPMVLSERAQAALVVLESRAGATHREKALVHCGKGIK